MNEPNWCEQVLHFDCEGEPLFGVASLPLVPKSTGVVIVVGGPQYRAGSHRQFVLLARRLAAQGYPVFRFDYRGMGDSPGELGLFESVEPDVGSAVDAFMKTVPAMRRVVLWGLCDGASAALLYCQKSADARIAGLFLMNPWIRTAASQAKTQVRHYYWDRLKQRQFWVKLFSGQVAASALKGFMGSVRAATQSASSAGAASAAYTTRMALGWQHFKGKGLLVLSDQDYTAREFEAYCVTDPVWTAALKSRPLARHALKQADHTCSQPSAEQAMQQATLDFLNSLPAC